jgi:methyl-accepting chemotaxis protein
MSIRLKLLAGFLAVLVLAGAQGVFSIIAISNTGQLASDLYNKTTMSISFAKSARYNFFQADSMFAAAVKSGSGDPAKQFEQVEELYELFTEDLEVVEERSGKDRSIKQVQEISAFGEKWFEVVTKTLKSDGEGQVSLPIGALESSRQPIIDALDLLIEFSSEDGFISSTAAEEVAASTLKINLIVIGVVTLIGILIALFIARNLSAPLNQMKDAMTEIAEGDTSIKVPAIGRSDEVGEMAQAVQVFKENAIDRIRLEKDAEKQRQVEQRAREDRRHEETKRQNEDQARVEREREEEEFRVAHERQAEEDRAESERQAEQVRINEREDKARIEAERAAKIDALTQTFEDNVTNVLSSVNSAVQDMGSSSGILSDTADSTNEQASAVATAAQEASANVQTVAAAAEELSASVREISSQVNESARIASNAVTEANETNAKVQGLAEAANKIGEVVELINDIASQTNLLALNATIEAARAGDAGKGFAVVASEVGNLANQTAKATEQISSQIDGIQSATAESVTAINSISSTINTIDNITTNIAAAVEEQGASTSEIARNVEQAATGTHEVTSNISTVSEAASKTGEAANLMGIAVNKLKNESDTLQGEVETFLQDIKAI